MITPETKIADLTVSELETLIRNVVLETMQVHKPLSISDLGWTREQALMIRGQLAAFAEDWDDPSMDIYDQD